MCELLTRVGCHGPHLRTAQLTIKIDLLTADTHAFMPVTHHGAKPRTAEVAARARAGWGTAECEGWCRMAKKKTSGKKAAKGGKSGKGATRAKAPKRGTAAVKEGGAKRAAARRSSGKAAKKAKVSRSSRQARTATPPSPHAVPAKPASSRGQQSRKRERPSDLDALRAKAAEAHAAFETAQSDAAAQHALADEAVAAAKQSYARSLAPYRAACRMAGVACEFPRVKAAPVAPRVRFLVERVDGGVKVAIKGRDETAETIDDATLRQSIGRAAKAFCERTLGTSIDEQGHKWAGLAGRIRNALNTA